jgi:hypothetical protein
MWARYRWCVTAGVAFVGASVIAVTPMTTPVPGIHLSDIGLTAGEEQITLDLVRSAEDSRSEPVINPVIPGPGLTEHGQEQAQELGHARERGSLRGNLCGAADQDVGDRGTVG